MAENWTLKGELMLGCNCTVFCPCVVSLGAHPPTEGFCMGWLGVRIDSGAYGGADIGGFNAAMLLDIPGRMGRGNWTVALYVDERADDAQAAGIESILTGQAGGSTSVLRMLVGTYLGAHKAPVTYETEGQTRHLKAGKKIEGVIAPIPAAGGAEHAMIKDSTYWIGKDVIIAQSKKSRVRDFGRVWDFPDLSAEIVPLDWSGPGR
ncbi:MAG: DUF1326 domain-containing protein [Rhodospirillales bacterium]